MAISPALVKHLRDKTGAGMADCKKALEEANGNEEQAIEFLRKRGAASATKRADRVAKEGVIVSAVAGDKTRAIMAEVNSETDFVARNETFIQFAQEIADAALAANPSTHEAFLLSKLSNGATIAEEVGAQTGRLGEKLEARRFEMVSEPSGFVTSYIHPGSKLGVLVAISGAKDGTAAALGRDIAMQIAAMNPMALKRDDIKTDQVEKELDIYRTQAKNEGKKDEIIDRIAKNKLEKFYQDNCLLEQSFIKDAAKTITDLLKEAGQGVTVTGFVRMQLGEMHKDAAE
ncbi:MAG: translation elongation factor Ts [Bacteroidota bacterium]|nr:translation elongation factor Ts [Bacteroidota bacterium]MDP4233749.1 translation elongation factor Ts [Bacteroidota bacterium]MDP4242388.1 translation elongation factor Ts [Bacteroidota bacterium]MDP4287510.1 translation elongation factor Ts [Bacteroidota bacterium]